eukprot:209034-Ditylum_brightwellii.AAC.1
MVKPTLEQFGKWQQAGIAVKYLRCNNTGKNRSLEKKAQISDWQFAITFEYTTRDTPQQNHLAELGFAVLAACGCTLMHRAKVPKAMRYQVFPEAFETATLLDGAVVVEVDGVKHTRYKHFCDKLPKFFKFLQQWGEAGTVKVRVKTTPKLNDRGVTCMMVGYAVKHEADCYEMLDPRTGTVYKTRDIIWLKRMYYQKMLQADDNDDVLQPWPEGRDPTDGTPALKQQDIEVDLEKESNDESILDVVGKGEKIPVPDVPTVMVARSGRVSRLPERLINEYEFGRQLLDAKLGASFSSVPLTPADIKYYAQIRELNKLSFLLVDMEHNKMEQKCTFVGAAGSGFNHTSELKVMNFDEAMASKDKKGWEKAVDKEHGKFVKYSVWKPVPKSKVPKDIKVLTPTLAMKPKANGTKHARLNASGFEQIDGLHYDSQDLLAPV